jgi:hypothetical protein
MNRRRHSRRLRYTETLAHPDHWTRAIEAEEASNEEFLAFRAAHLAAGPAGIQITIGNLVLRLMTRIAIPSRERRANAVSLNSRSGGPSTSLPTRNGSNGWWSESTGCSSARRNGL